jgi:hypothetical protein
MGERSRRRVRDLVTQLAFEGRSQNETERARISMMARSDLLHARAGYRSARPTIVLEDSACNARPVHTVGSRRMICPSIRNLQHGATWPFCFSAGGALRPPAPIGAILAETGRTCATGAPYSLRPAPLICLPVLGICSRTWMGEPRRRGSQH